MDEPELLTEAANEIRNGSTARARQLLTIVLSQNPDDEQALLLMVKTTEDVREKVKYASRAIRVNPDNVESARLLESLETDLWRSLDLKELAQETSAAIKAGDKVTARRIVNLVLRRDPENQRAWLILAELSDDPQAKRECLKRVLEINPKNAAAKQELRSLDKRSNRTVEPRSVGVEAPVLPRSPDRLEMRSRQRWVAPEAPVEERPWYLSTGILILTFLLVTPLWCILIFASGKWQSTWVKVVAAIFMLAYLYFFCNYLLILQSAR